MNISKIGGALCIVGGIAWAFKFIYDWQVLGRLEHQGYIPSDVTDYYYFIVPLLCIAGLMTLFKQFKNKFRRMEKWGLAIASTGLLLVSVFHFYNAYFYYSELPAGLFFLMPGMLFSFIGMLSYVIAAFRSKVIPKWVLWIPTVLCALMIIWPFASALIYQYYGNEVSTRYGAIIQVLTGLTWAALGVKLFIEKQNQNKQSVTQKALN